MVTSGRDGVEPLNKLFAEGWEFVDRVRMRGGSGEGRDALVYVLRRKVTD